MWEGSIKWIVFPAPSMGLREDSNTRGRPCLVEQGLLECVFSEEEKGVSC